MLNFIAEYEFVKQIIDNSNSVVVGVDEVGRGPLAGPVFSAAVCFHKNTVIGLNDSKKLTTAKREELYDTIINSALVAIGVASVDEIDSMNILQATKLAMARAITNLNIDIDLILVDGTQPPQIKWKTKCVVGGDGLYPSIAAASIVAKVRRDHLMQELHQEYPQYNWEKNKGYGTAFHLESLVKFGISPHHRRSFKPIADLLLK